MAPLYDVLQANEYAHNWGDVPPLTGDLFSVVNDARYAASAVRETGRTSFIYMTSICDVMWKTTVPVRPGTYKEVRYTMFAPLTQGAMGINPWVLYRASENYREAVVYPILREVKRFVPWFLGKWHDEKVSSDHDAASRDYLQKLSPQIREIMGDKGASPVKMAGVPDCSYMLRENPDKSYLLLAVNNCKEPMDVTFTFHNLQKLPDKALEMLEYYSLPIVDNKLKDHFAPYDVRAYILKIRPK